MKNKCFACALLLLCTQVHAVEIDKTDWVSHMMTVVPVSFCQSDQYFRQCFDVTSEQCEETMTSATRVCLSNHESDIPDRLAQPDEGRHWGTVVGKCVGETYVATLASKHNSKAICFDPTHWQQ